MFARIKVPICNAEEQVGNPEKIVITVECIRMIRSTEKNKKWIIIYSPVFPLSLRAKWGHLKSNMTQYRCK